MKKILSFLLITLSLWGRPWEPPYISGDAFRAIADFVFDETRDFNPRDVREGDVIFIKTDLVEDFFRGKHPYIRNPYVLISHNGDYPVPRRCGHYLNDPKLLAWFGQNVEGYTHLKLRPLPIGIANQYIPNHGNVEALKRCRARMQEHSRTYLAYLNINTGTNCQERSSVYRMFTGKPFVWERGGRCFEDYLTDLSEVKFVISPRGNGLDCHRTWEALYMGAIPIVTTSSLDAIFKDLPVLIIHDWNEVTESFLNQKYQEITSRNYDLSPLYMPYWIREIQKFKTRF